jgi:hypothetical protein
MPDRAPALPWRSDLPGARRHASDLCHHPPLLGHPPDDGILGNATFLTGSLLFLHDVKPWSIYLFIVGSVGMLIGNVGGVLVQLERSYGPVR